MAMKLFSIAEAAEALSVSANTVRGLCRARKLRHERHGLGYGVIRIPEDAVAEYRSSVTVAPAERKAGQARKPAPPRVKLRHLNL